MKYYKNMADGYIQSISQDKGQTEITETEYNAILSVLANRPLGNYRLTESLEWEEFEVPINPDVDDAEALDILMGVEE